LDPPYSVNFDPKIDSVRKVNFTLAPGGIAKFHSKIGRPTLLQVIKGTLTSHPQGRPEAILHAGEGLVEIDDGNYWVENTGGKPAEFIFLHVHDNRTHRLVSFSPIIPKRPRHAATYTNPNDHGSNLIDSSGSAGASLVKQTIAAILQKSAPPLTN